MVRERKCILCHIVYSSKKEMDEHMRSMLHHRELENLKGRDSNHECRVCRVTVVGLSAYAKHISSQLHKDNADAYDREEEGKEEADEEYFDQELVQLINQRKEQNGQDETCNTSQEPATNDRRLQRKREDRGAHQDRDNYDQAGWHHHGTPQRDWKWENECFVNPRQGNFPHSARNPNSSKYPSGPRGRAGWHVITSGGPARRHLNLANSGGVWHSNGGGPVSWHHRGTGRNHNWHPESCFSFPTWHPSNCGGNWKSNPHGANGWNDAFPPGRNRIDEMALGWNKKRGRSIKYNRVRYTWERQENDHNNALTPYGDPAEEQCDRATYAMDFTNDKLPPEGAFDFSIPEKSDHKSTKCTGKGASPSRDKQHRWSPYPSQKAAENHPGTVDNVAENSEKDPSSLSFQSPQNTVKDPKIDTADIFPKLSMKEDLVHPSKNKLDADSSICCKESAETADGRRADQDDSKSNRMPSLKSPLLATLDKKLSIQKRSPTNMQKSSKLLSPSSPRDGRTRSGALNLEIYQSNSYISKLRSASCRNLKGNKGAVDTSPKEPVESLSEVLRKAKEILQCSQSMRSQHFLESCKKQSEEASNTEEVSKSSEKRTALQMDFLENVSDGELSDYDNSETKDENPGPVSTSSSCVIPSCEDTSKEDNSVETSGKLPSGSDITAPPKYPTIEMKSVESTSSLVHNLEPAVVESEGSEDPLKSDAPIESEGVQNNIFDQEMQKGGSQQSLLPELSKLGLPVSLQRDLTRHIGSKSKPGSHLPEPNLNSARRIRNVSGHRKSETDKESGLKPTLRQILNASRRNVNWEQVIQHVSKKKQELGKGLPRFGIEMVAPVQNENEGLDLEEEPDLTNFEGLHWEAISMTLPASARKRSLSESSIVVDRTACVYNFFDDQATDRRIEQRQSIPTSQSGWSAPSANASEEMWTVPKREDTARPSSPTLEKSASLSSGSQHSTLSPITASSIKREAALQSLDNQNKSASPEEGQSLGSAGASIFPTSNLVDAATDSSCTSGTDQNDSQSVGKKRRATVDGSSPEIPSLERKNKRRKLKGKKERSQVDQLLTISLREEELSRSLQSLDTNLLQARATLQAAYVDVQRLMVLKQQITMEMSAMRTQRIQILQGLQETLEPSEQADQSQGNLSGERRSSRLQAAAPVDLNPSHLFSLFLDTPSYISPHRSPSGATLGTPLRVSTPPAFQDPGRVANAAPDSSVPVKQEPPSSQGGKTDVNTLLHGSLHTLQGGSLQTPGEISQSPSIYPIITASLSELTRGFPSVQEESAADRGRPQPAETQLTSHSMSSRNSKGEGSDSTHGGALSERRTSVFQCKTLPGETSLENESTHPLRQLEQKQSTLASVESRGSKKKKKLRKKKTLRAAHVPDNSDTEQDICGKPVRKVKCKKMPKEGAVATSTSFEQEDDSMTPATGKNKDENDTDSPVEVAAVSNHLFEVVDINDSESGDGKPDSPSKRDPLNSTEKILEVARLGYDEVSSTSEMGANYRDGVLRSVAETQTPISSVRGSKNSSEVSSEPGEDEDPTEGIFEGHQAAVNAIQIFGGLLYTCSADKTVRAYSLVSRKCVAIFEGHTSKVNCLLLTPTSGKNAVLYTGSSDHTIRCYNNKSRECINQFQLEDRVVCLHTRWRILFGGLANGNVVTFGIKSGRQLDTFECHGPRAVSCLASAQEGARRLLLVGSYDCTISVRDARNGLLLRTLEGHSKTVLCMKVVNDLVFSGSSDQSIHAHNIHTGELVRIYKGHNHAVTVVNILGKVMVTASLDKFVRVYELQSHDRLQVYGGHTDMIMCMTIHKSMIYTGCYDGSIQAVRLNLMQNYRCWWHGCSLIFGVVDHLKQHLLSDHTNPNFQTLKCRWKNCDAFFTARRGSKQDAPGHIERHAEEDSKMDT